MNTRARKAKGARLQKTVTLKFRESFHGILSDKDIKSQPMGQAGADVVLSPAAQSIIPLCIECKNVEALVSSQMKDAIRQSEEYTEGGTLIPVLVFKSNNEPERVILTLDNLFKLIYPKEDVLINATSAQKLLIQLEQVKQTVLTLSKEKT